MLPRTTERIHASFINALAVVCVLTAVVLSALRLAVAYAPAFQGKAETLLSQWLGYPVAISALSTRLNGFTPVLIVHGLRIGGATGHQPDLAAGRIEFSIDLWDSLRHLQTQFIGLDADHLELTLRRLRNGRIVFRNGEGRIGRELLALTAHLRLHDASITLVDKANGKTWRVTDTEAVFRRTAQGYQLNTRFTPEPRLAQQVELAMRWQDRSASLGKIDGSAYLHLQDARLERIGAALPPAWGQSMFTGQGDAQIWMTLQRGLPERVVVDLNAHGLDLGRSQAERFQHLAGRGLWQRNSRGWSLDVNALTLQRPGSPPSPPSAVSVRYSASANGAALWRARASFLALGDFATLARSSELLPRAWREALAGLAPQGEVRDVSLVAQTRERQRHWRLSARFQRLSLQPYRQVPGLTDGSGQLLATDRGGRMQFDARNTELKLPEFFLQPLPLDRLRLQSQWRVYGKEVQLAIPVLQASSPAGELEARIGLWLGGAHGAFVDARAHLQQANAALVTHYLPQRALSKGVGDWLVSAIRAGRIPQADLMLYGLIEDFPYREGDGVFDVQAQLDDVSLAYRPGWPALKGLNARLSVHRGALQVVAEGGRIFHSVLRHASADMADLESPRLEVRCSFSALGNDVLRYLGESPLGTGKAEDWQQITLSGRHRLDLQLSIPFGDQPLRVDGRLYLNAARFAVRGRDPAIEDLSGVISFDENAVSWDRLRGRFAGHALVSRAFTIGQGNGRRILIETRFQASVAQLIGSDNPLAARFPGTTDWLLRIDTGGLRSAGAALDLTLQSDLRGVQVNLPESLAKRLSTPRRLTIKTRLGAGGPYPVHVRYAGVGSAIATLVPHSRALERLGVHLGKGQARLPKEPGTQVTGNLERLDLAGLSGLDTGAELTWLPPVRRVELKIGRLVWGETPLVDALRVNARPTPADWLIELAGPNIAGRVRWPRHEQDRAQVSLARLNLAGFPEPGARESWLQSKSLQLPGMDIAIDALQVKEGSLGRFNMRLDRVRDGLVMQALSLNGPVLKAKASGHWRSGSEQGESMLDLEATSGNTGRALALFGFAQAIANGTTHAKAHLQWPGTLQDLGTKDLTGAVQFTVQHGSLLKVQPGAGRVFGLLSVATLPRRLMLDFSDLFGKGLAFDRIKASFRLEKGIANPEMFYIDSPAARVEVSGPVDLVRRQYDQTVTVMPHFSSAVSLIGGLAGGPVAGVLLFLTQQLFQADLAKLAQYQYRIIGSWEYPRVEGMDYTQAPPVQGVSR